MNVNQIKVQETPLVDAVAATRPFLVQSRSGAIRRAWGTSIADVRWELHLTRGDQVREDPFTDINEIKEISN